MKNLIIQTQIFNLQSILGHVNQDIIHFATKEIDPDRVEDAEYEKKLILEEIEDCYDALFLLDSVARS
jgi:hypothetical protein